MQNIKSKVGNYPCGDSSPIFTWSPLPTRKHLSLREKKVSNGFSLFITGCNSKYKKNKFVNIK
ncbi:hypothetical protein NQ314_008236 [Rhamnusium bicolor]|uniref:Uncharacterized protein n=1 Tax=Rhamnusium bicolor TaxID=1586634 RepID=A0AAV8YEP0_9CUCU|nr:hypothetical protein NQ314_008236 [Rhamnusium bicolor]